MNAYILNFCSKYHFKVKIPNDLKLVIIIFNLLKYNIFDNLSNLTFDEKNIISNFIIINFIAKFDNDISDDLIIKTELTLKDFKINSNDINNALGIYYYMTKNYSQMIIYFEKSLSISSNNLAIYYENTNDFQNAKKYYKIAVKNNDVNAIYNLIKFHKKNNNFNKMLKYQLMLIEQNCFEKSLEKNLIHVNVDNKYFVQLLSCSKKNFSIIAQQILNEQIFKTTFWNPVFEQYLNEKNKKKIEKYKFFGKILGNDSILQKNDN